MKRNRFSLTLRIFLTTSVLLIVACAITYGAIAYLTPITYTSVMADELAQQGDALVAALEGVTPEHCETLLMDFVRRTGTDIRLTDGSGNVLYDTQPAPQNEIIHESIVEMVVEDVIAVSDAAVSATEASVEEDLPFASQEASSQIAESPITSSVHSFAFVDGTEGWLTIEGGMRAVNQAMEALTRVLPFLIGIVLLISLAGSYFYAWFITRPIVSISRIARRMAALDFNAHWDKARRDEIGELGESLNLLSANLSQALNELESANAKLQSDIDRERELERQRMAFFSAASHELKTPITILKGQLSGMLAQVGIYQDREKYLARALTVTGRMEALVKEILTINRIGTAGFAIKSESVNLSELMQKQLEMDQELIEQKEYLLVTHIAPDVIVQGDEPLLAKVLDNVLMNAILYSPPGATVTVSVQENGFSVDNTGVFIPEDSLSSLFTAFYRVEQSRNRKSGGSGLGLHLVKSILDLHGAEYTLENTERGVRFTARFRDATVMEDA